MDASENPTVLWTVEEFAAPDSLSTGDFVSWGYTAPNGETYRVKGRIIKIAKDSKLDVPGTDITVTGTPDDPAALIRKYEKKGTLWKPTDTIVGHRFSELTKIKDLKESSVWSVEADRDAKENALVAGPGDLFGIDEWEALIDDDEIIDAVGDAVMDAATSASLVARSGAELAEIDFDTVIARHVSRLKQLGPQLQATVREGIAAAVAEGKTIGQMSQWLVESSPLSASSAKAFARTELTAAANAGLQAAWSVGKVPLKRWRSMEDGRVRIAHAVADGQVVPVDMAFDIAGSRAMYPGDPSLPIGLRINCRCYMERVDANGQIRSDRLSDANRDELYEMAKDLNIPGRSRMRKPELLEKIQQWSAGFGDQRIDEMTRPQLLQRARVAEIRGRHKMSKSQLLDELSTKCVVGPRSIVAAAGGECDFGSLDDFERARKDAGYVSRDELAADQAQARKALDDDSGKALWKDKARRAEVMEETYDFEDPVTGWRTRVTNTGLGGDEGDDLFFAEGVIERPKPQWAAGRASPAITATDRLVDEVMDEMRGDLIDIGYTDRDSVAKLVERSRNFGSGREALDELITARRTLVDETMAVIDEVGEEFDDIAIVDALQAGYESARTAGMSHTQALDLVTKQFNEITQSGRASALQRLIDDPSVITARFEVAPVVVPRASLVTELMDEQRGSLIDILHHDRASVEKLVDQATGIGPGKDAVEELIDARRIFVDDSIGLFERVSIDMDAVDTNALNDRLSESYVRLRQQGADHVRAVRIVSEQLDAIEQQGALDAIESIVADSDGFTRRLLPGQDELAERIRSEMYGHLAEIGQQDIDSVKNLIARANRTGLDVEDLILSRGRIADDMMALVDDGLEMNVDQAIDQASERYVSLRMSGLDHERAIAEAVEEIVASDEVARVRQEMFGHLVEIGRQDPTSVAELVKQARRTGIDVEDLIVTRGRINEELVDLAETVGDVDEAAEQVMDRYVKLRQLGVDGEAALKTALDEVRISDEQVERVRKEMFGHLSEIGSQSPSSVRQLIDESNRVGIDVEDLILSRGRIAEDVFELADEGLDLDIDASIARASDRYIELRKAGLNHDNAIKAAVNDIRVPTSDEISRVREEMFGHLAEIGQQSPESVEQLIRQANRSGVDVEDLILSRGRIADDLMELADEGIDFDVDASIEKASDRYVSLRQSGVDHEQAIKRAVGEVRPIGDDEVAKLREEMFGHLSEIGEQSPASVRNLIGQANSAGVDVEDLILGRGRISEDLLEIVDETEFDDVSRAATDRYVQLRQLGHSHERAIEFAVDEVADREVDRVRNEMFGYLAETGRQDKAAVRELIRQANETGIDVEDLIVSRSQLMDEITGLIDDGIELDFDTATNGAAERYVQLRRNGLSHADAIRAAIDDARYGDVAKIRQELYGELVQIGRQDEAALRGLIGEARASRIDLEEVIVARQRFDDELAGIVDRLGLDIDGDLNSKLVSANDTLADAYGRLRRNGMSHEDALSGIVRQIDEAISDATLDGITALDAETLAGMIQVDLAEVDRVWREMYGHLVDVGMNTRAGAQEIVLAAKKAGVDVDDLLVARSQFADEVNGLIDMGIDDEAGFERLQTALNDSYVSGRQAGRTHSEALDRVLKELNATLEKGAADKLGALDPVEFRNRVMKEAPKAKAPKVTKAQARAEKVEQVMRDRRMELDEIGFGEKAKVETLVKDAERAGVDVEELIVARRTLQTELAQIVDELGIELDEFDGVTDTLTDAYLAARTTEYNVTASVFDQETKKWIEGIRDRAYDHEDALQMVRRQLDQRKSRDALEAIVEGKDGADELRLDLRKDHLALSDNDMKKPIVDRPNADRQVVPEKREVEYETIGEFRRSLRPDGTVTNDLLMLDPEFQGAGFASRFTEVVEERYRDAGIRTIKVTAGKEVGGYAWAKQGFAIDFEADVAMGAEVSGMVAYQTIDMKITKMIADKVITETEGAELRQLLKGNDMFGVASHPKGKDLLMGTVWPGVKRL